MAGRNLVRIALAQLRVGANKEENIQRAVAAVKEAASNGARLVALPVGGCFVMERA